MFSWHFAGCMREIIFKHYLLINRMSLYRRKYICWLYCVHIISLLSLYNWTLNNNCLWPENATITECIPTQCTARKRHITLITTWQHKYNWSKATSFSADEISTNILCNCRLTVWLFLDFAITIAKTSYRSDLESSQQINVVSESAWYNCNTSSVFRPLRTKEINIWYFAQNTRPESLKISTEVYACICMCICIICLFTGLIPV